MTSVNTMYSVHLDETACGPLCQHPQCWASNRRVGRGLPRVAESPTINQDLEDELPTVKIFNLLDEYGDSNNDRYPSKEGGKDTKVPSHIRSASAPNIMAAYNRSPLAAFTPFTSPMGVKGGSVRSTRSAKTQSTRSRSRTTPKISRLEVKEMLGGLGDLPPPSSESSSFYVWCPSNKSYQKRMKRPEEIHQSTSKEPLTIRPKDLTDDMVPNLVEKKRKSKTQKSKRNVHETPTGGRPYTHPSRSPPPVARRTLPQDIDDGINQLLSLPRDVLMEVLDHIKKSDILDKGKVQLLISRLMPLIHFQEDAPGTPRGSITTPLLDSGILQNRKVTLHDMQDKMYDKHEFQQTQGNVPFFLDDAALSIMASSVCDGTHQIIEEQLEDSPRMEEHMETVSTGRMAKTRPLGPIKGQRESEHIYRISSVSAKTLPPLKPGVKPVKPFNYTNNASTLDLTLVPLPRPKPASPERTIPTPFSLVASTLHVTIPSVPSPDRTLNSTPVMQYGKSPVPPVPRSGVARSSPSPLPSEEFPELHWYDADVEEHRHPLHALSPSMSTRVPKTPLGTPATNLRQHLLTREAIPSKLLSEHAEEESGATSSSPTPHPPVRTGTDMSEAQLGTIHETGSINSTYPLGDSATGFNSRSDYITSPSKLLMSSMSPYGFSASIAGQMLEKESSFAPVTPAPTYATEESWPNIDERDYMRTPDTRQETVMVNQQTELPAPVAPPPSPEPRDPDYEFQMPEVSKSVTLSLTPLAEEEEEIDDHVNDNRYTYETSQPEHPVDSSEMVKNDRVEKHVDFKVEDAIENKASEDLDEAIVSPTVETGAVRDSKINEQTTEDSDPKLDVPEDHTKEVSNQDPSGALEAKETSEDSKNQQIGNNESSLLALSSTEKGTVEAGVVTPKNETIKKDDTMSKIETKTDDVTPKNETTTIGDVMLSNESTQNNDITPISNTNIDTITVKETPNENSDVMPKNETAGTSDVIDSKRTKELQKNSVEANAIEQNLNSDNIGSTQGTVKKNPIIENIQRANNTSEETCQPDAEQTASPETEKVKEETVNENNHDLNDE